MTEQINRIKNKEDFIQFIKDLSSDYKEHSEQWANTTISDFLLQAASWIEDYSVCPVNDIIWEKVDFQILAKILYMGKLYE